MKRLYAILLSMILAATMIGFAGCDIGKDFLTAGDITPGNVTNGDTTDGIYFEELPMIMSDEFVFTVENAKRDEIEETWSINVIIENKNLDLLKFSITDVIINGVDFNTLWVCEVLPNEIVNGSLTFSFSEFAENDIEAVETIEFTLNIYDKDDNIINEVEHKFSLTVAKEIVTPGEVEAQG